MHTDQELITTIVRATQAYIRVANRAFRNDVPEDIEISFVDNSRVRRGSGERKLKVLSESSFVGSDPMTLTVKYHMEALRGHPEVFLNYVIPHEVAHLVVFRKFNQAGVNAEVHGAEWCAVMKRFGKDPAKSLDVAKATYEMHVKAQKKALEDVQDGDGEQDYA